MTIILSLVLFACASDEPVYQKPVVEDTPVIGKGTVIDRNAINSSNQQIYNTIHATPGTPTASPGTPNQGKP